MDPAPGELEVIFGASNEPQAALVLGLLQSAGIPAVLLDGNLTTYQIVMAVATRGYRIAVPRPRAEEAEEVLIQNGFIDPDLQEAIPPGAAVCPKCLHTVLPAAPNCAKCGEPFDWSVR